MVAETIQALSLAMLLAALLSGCVSSKYKRADAEDIPPPVSLCLTSEQSSVTATVHSVIVFHGPGSWKRDACWDEYVVSVTNHGGAPLEVQSVTLTDFLGDATVPGDNPWRLEDESKARSEELNRNAKNTLVQLGAGFGSAYVGTGLALGAGVAAGMLALPVYIGGAIYRNVSSRHNIEHEFAHRRFVLPATIAPGQTVQGSLFFRIAPAPQRLVLHGQAGDAPVEVIIGLAPLAGLHLKSAEEK